MHFKIETLDHFSLPLKRTIYLKVLNLSKSPNCLFSSYSFRLFFTIVFQTDDDVLFTRTALGILLTLLLFMLGFCQFFTTNPLPCNPSSLPKFSPTKEFDSKRREKEATRYYKFHFPIY